MGKIYKFSPLGKTWIFDLDGTIFKHNGYKIDGVDSLLPGVKDFFENTIKKEDFVIIVSSRKSEFEPQTKEALATNGIRFDCLIFNVPYGERILINDSKPSGLCTSYSYCPKRDEGLIDL